MQTLGEMGTPPVAYWAAGLLAALVMCAAVADLKHGLVPNWLTYPAIMLGLVGHFLAGGVWGDRGGIGLAGAAAGFAAGFLPLLLCWLAGGIGGGDAKLMGAIGCLGGWRIALGAMMYGFVIAALMAVVVMVRKGVVRRTFRRVAHAALLLLTPGAARPADPTTADSPRIPFAVALCAGTLVVLAEELWRRGTLWRLAGG